MGLVFATTVVVCLVALVKGLQVLARRIEQDLAAQGNPGGPAGAAPPRVGERTMAGGRYSEWQVRRQCRVLVDEVEVFLAGRIL